MISTIGGLLNLNHLDQGSRANDVIVIRHRDGSLHSSPFCIRFGRAKIWNSLNKVVQVEVNGVLTSAVMKIGKGGEAYWLQPTYDHLSDHHNHRQQRTLQQQNSTEEIVGDEVNASTHDASDSARMTFPLDTEKASANSSFFPPAAATTASSSASQKASGDAARATALTLASEMAAVSSAGSDTSADPGPLLEERDDGTIGVPRSAIQSAGDAEQAKLALRAVAAAVKSRKRLSRLITEDPFLLESARQEGEAGEVLREAVAAEGDEGAVTVGVDEEKPEAAAATAAGEGPFVEVTAIFQPARSTASDPFVSGDGFTHAKDSRHNSATDEKKAAPPKDGEEIPAAIVVTDPQTNTATKATDTTLRPESTTRRRRPARYVVDSDSSDELLFGADDDDYFLDPIDADDFAQADLDVSAEAAERVLRNCSFASSVTSGVSLEDVPRVTSEEAGEGTPSLGATLPKKMRAPLQTAGATEHASADLQAESPQALPCPPQQAGASTRARGASFPVDEQRHRDVVDDGEAVSDGNLSDTPAAAAAPASTVNGDHRHLSLPDAIDSGAGTNYFVRTLIPIEEDLRKLNLVDGCNKVRYLAHKGKDEVVTVSCNIFLWSAMDRLVVSDVDGTITKSDLWGHFYAAFGKGADWTHPGICSLYSKIVANGYRMIYLTARSVAQIKQTKGYLWSLRQDGVGLPLGPVLTAPQRFFTALTQEVSKQSHVFKIACLTSVKSAFPPHARPFFAGFGNRYNDLISYDAVGIPTHRIFIIDPSSVLHVCQVKQTYRNLAHLVDVTFPRVHRRRYPQAPLGAPARGAGVGSGGSPSSVASSDGDASETEETGSVNSAGGGALPSGSALHHEHSASAMFAMAGSDLRSAVLLPTVTDGGWAAGGGGNTDGLSVEGGLVRVSASVSGGASSPKVQGGTNASVKQARSFSAETNAGSNSNDRYYGMHHHEHLHHSHPHGADDDVIADPEFSSYSYWRIDPRAVLATSAPAKPLLATTLPGHRAASTTEPAPPTAVTLTISVSPSSTASTPAGQGKMGSPAVGPAIEAKPPLLSRGFGRGAGVSSAAATAADTVGTGSSCGSFLKVASPTDTTATGTVSAAYMSVQSEQGSPKTSGTTGCRTDAAGNSAEFVTAVPTAAPTNTTKRGFFSRFTRGRVASDQAVVNAATCAADNTTTAKHVRCSHAHPDYMIYMVDVTPQQQRTALCADPAPLSCTPSTSGPVSASPASGGSAVEKPEATPTQA